MASGLVFDIRRFCVHDGPGIRTTVFLKGCPLACAWCHNPEGISPHPQMAWRKALCLRCGACVQACPNDALRLTDDGLQADPLKCRMCGLCAEACPTGARARVGSRMEVGELVAEAIKDRAFFEESGGGVTFSGGEPTMQAEFLLACCRALREQGVHVAVDTCAFAAPEVFEQLLGCVDLFLVDLKAAGDDQSLRLTGAPLGPITANAELLARTGKASFAMPLVPGANDDPATLRGVAVLLLELGVTRLAILPHHRLGQDKMGRFGAYQPVQGFREPTQDDLERVVRTFQECGVHASLGRRHHP